MMSRGKKGFEVPASDGWAMFVSEICVEPMNMITLRRDKKR